jgi:molybdopterin biosynthesis enzyme MoaB
MSKDISELKLAVEKLIDLIGHHDTSIENMKMIQEFHSTKLDKTNKIDLIDDRIKTIERDLTSLSSRLRRLEARIGLVELDSTTDHQLYDHNTGVVEDWHTEAEAGINTDLIPLSKVDIIDRFQKYTDRKKH